MYLTFLRGILYPSKEVTIKSSTKYPDNVVQLHCHGDNGIRQSAAGSSSLKTANIIIPKLMFDTDTFQ